MAGQTSAVPSAGSSVSGGRLPPPSALSQIIAGVLGFIVFLYTVHIGHAFGVPLYSAAGFAFAVSLVVFIPFGHKSAELLHLFDWAIGRCERMKPVHNGHMLNRAGQDITGKSRKDASSSLADSPESSNQPTAFRFYMMLVLASLFAFCTIALGMYAENFLNRHFSSITGIFEPFEVRIGIIFAMLVGVASVWHLGSARWLAYGVFIAFRLGVFLLSLDFLFTNGPTWGTLVIVNTLVLEAAILGLEYHILQSAR